jgi:hypothetical protein
MKLTKAYTIIYKTKTKKAEKQLWERYLVEIPYFEKAKSFDDYKKEIFEFARLKSRTKEDEN